MHTHAGEDFHKNVHKKKENYFSNDLHCMKGSHKTKGPGRDGRPWNGIYGYWNKNAGRNASREMSTASLA